MLTQYLNVLTIWNAEFTFLLHLNIVSLYPERLHIVSPYAAYGLSFVLNRVPHNFCTTPFVIGKAGF